MCTEPYDSSVPSFRAGKRSPESIKLLATGLGFTEGPVVVPDGSLIAVEIKDEAVTRIAANGQVRRLLHVPGGPNGAAAGPDGRVYICNNGGFAWIRRDGVDLVNGPAGTWTGVGVQVIDLVTGSIDTLFTECGGEPLRAPNDLVFDADGGIYFTDHGSTCPRHQDRGGLYYISPDFTEIREIAYPLGRPNGVALSPDGSRVYVADTMTAKLLCWDIESPGVLRPGARDGGASFLWRVPTGGTLDSIAVDSEGNIAAAVIGESAVVVVSPAGELLAVHEVPGNDPVVTNVAFGGADMRRAVIASGGRGSVFEMEWHCPGLTLNFNDLNLLCG